MSTPAGWYDDGSGRLRWWDGTAWTEHVAPAQPEAAPPAPADASAPSTWTSGADGQTVEPEQGTTDAAAAVAAPSSASESFVPPYQMPSAHGTDPAPGYGYAASPGAAPAAQPLAPAAAPPANRVSVLGLVGLGAAVVGVVLACIPPIALAGWIVLGLALVLSLVSLFLPGRKWPGITGLGVTVLGAILAAAIALISLGFDRAQEADELPVFTPSEEPSSDAPADAETEDPSEIEGAEMVPVPELEVGDCLPLVEDWDEEVVYEVPVVPCDQPHTDEVYFISELPDGDFPGDGSLQEQADSLCIAEFETFVGMSYEASELDYYWYVPTEASWKRWGDRRIQCIVFSYEDVTGTLQGAGR